PDRAEQVQLIIGLVTLGMCLIAAIAAWTCPETSTKKLAHGAEDDNESEADEKSRAGVRPGDSERAAEHDLRDGSWLTKGSRRFAWSAASGLRSVPRARGAGSPALFHVAIIRAPGPTTTGALLHHPRPRRTSLRAGTDRATGTGRPDQTRISQP